MTAQPVESILPVPTSHIYHVLAMLNYAGSLQVDLAAANNSLPCTDDANVPQVLLYDQRMLPMCWIDVSFRQCFHLLAQMHSWQVTTCQQRSATPPSMCRACW